MSLPSDKSPVERGSGCTTFRDHVGRPRCCVLSAWAHLLFSALLRAPRKGAEGRLWKCGQTPSLWHRAPGPGGSSRPAWPCSVTLGPVPNPQLVWCFLAPSGRYAPLSLLSALPALCQPRRWRHLVWALGLLLSSLLARREIVPWPSALPGRGLASLFQWLWDLQRLGSQGGPSPPKA